MNKSTYLSRVAILGIMVIASSAFGAASSSTALLPTTAVSFDEAPRVAPVRSTLPPNWLHVLPDEIQQKIRIFLMGKKWVAYKEARAIRIPDFLAPKLFVGLRRLEPVFNPYHILNKAKTVHPVYGELSIVRSPVFEDGDPQPPRVMLTHEGVSKVIPLSAKAQILYRAYFIGDVVVIEYQDLNLQASETERCRCSFIHAVTGKPVEVAVIYTSTSFRDSHEPGVGIRRFFEEGENITLDNIAFPAASARGDRLVEVNGLIMDLVAQRCIQITPDFSDGPIPLYTLPGCNSLVLIFRRDHVILFDIDKGRSIFCLPLSKGSAVLGLVDTEILKRWAPELVKDASCLLEHALLVSESDGNPVGVGHRLVVPMQPLGINCLLAEGEAASYTPGAGILEAVRARVRYKLQSVVLSAEAKSMSQFPEVWYPQLASRYTACMAYIRKCLEQDLGEYGVDGPYTLLMDQEKMVRVSAEDCIELERVVIDKLVEYYRIKHLFGSSFKDMNDVRRDMQRKFAGLRPRMYRDLFTKIQQATGLPERLITVENTRENFTEFIALGDKKLGVMLKRELIARCDFFRRGSACMPSLIQKIEDEIPEFARLPDDVRREWLEEIQMLTELPSESVVIQEVIMPIQQSVVVSVAPAASPSLPPTRVARLIQGVYRYRRAIGVIGLLCVVAYKIRTPVLKPVAIVR